QARLGVRVVEVRRLHLAAEPDELCTSWTVVRHRMVEVVEVELRQGLAHLAAVGTRLEVVELEHALRLWPPVGGDARRDSSAEPDDRGSEGRQIVDHEAADSR